MRAKENYPDNAGVLQGSKPRQSISPWQKNKQEKTQSSSKRQKKHWTKFNTIYIENPPQTRSKLP